MSEASFVSRSLVYLWFFPSKDLDQGILLVRHQAQSWFQADAIHADPLGLALGVALGVCTTVFHLGRGAAANNQWWFRKVPLWNKYSDVWLKYAINGFKCIWGQIISRPSSCLSQPGWAQAGGGGGQHIFPSCRTLSRGGSGKARLREVATTSSMASQRHDVAFSPDNFVGPICKMQCSN